MKIFNLCDKTMYLYYFFLNRSLLYSDHNKGMWNHITLFLCLCVLCEHYDVRNQSLVIVIIRSVINEN